jgi:hypothetical protein
MLRPIGNLPAAVYWRRRLLLLGSLVVLLVLFVLTVKALGGGDGSSAAAATSSSTPPTEAVVQPPATQRTSSSTASTSKRHKPATTSTSTSKSSAPPAQCTAAMLKVQAVVERSSYQVGDQPVVMLEATDTSSVPCVQDFGNGHVELRIYNGESRVWGSNDCGSKAASIERTLTPNQPVRVRVTWSGLSSQPKLCDHRQRVGAGTYTLYASLSGKQGSATQFALN